MSIEIMPSIEFLKGHGAGNDFIIIPDVSDALDLQAHQVRFLCDRHNGIGADGVLRVVQIDEQFFMDYRNADGTLAETCGNGIRVFARYLIEAGLQSRGTFAILTRAGTVEITVSDDDADFNNIAAVMGTAVHTSDQVLVHTESGVWTGSCAWMPNPHCISVVDDIAAVGTLHIKPEIDNAQVFPMGTNFEFIETRASNRIGMRTYERGVGETLACGSGACAAAAVFALQSNLSAPWTVQVDVLGGTVFVDSNEFGVLTLRGPARIVARGTTSLSSAPA
ncbi:MAG: diaminopimelate epimerase [Actinobacteria bacterium]|uniref:diaminopimelate epimerase n=1 Tax=freshwater metagenome TaxID=449393 RepID=A0A6J5Z6S8_9ZZZZ|nr:diaminopimelate epimerase [Actinomycetota bacterium]